MARSYARVAASLPRPPDGAKLFVQLGNELNLAWDCACERGNVCMSMERVAAEAAFFSRDALAALKQVPGLAVAISPIAPVGLQARPCCRNASECRAAGGDDAACACAGGTDISFTSLSFEQLLIKATVRVQASVEVCRQVILDSRRRVELDVHGADLLHQRLAGALVRGAGERGADGAVRER